ncbi:hypothetical protein N431DRAFT_465659 [Stipitochalara longipes BDJ]|nr:hypothetical protein N431DRAFT_465659 [Stipitochalara longipes BDJ]
MNKSAHLLYFLARIWSTIRREYPPKSIGYERAIKKAEEALRRELYESDFTESEPHVPTLAPLPRRRSSTLRAEAPIFTPTKNTNNNYYRVQPVVPRFRDNNRHVVKEASSVTPSAEKKEGYWKGSDDSGSLTPKCPPTPLEKMKVLVGSKLELCPYERVPVESVERKALGPPQAFDAPYMPPTTLASEEETQQRHCHVIKTTKLPFSRYDRRSLEYLREKVARQLYNLERVLTAKQQYSAASLISIARYDGSYLALPNPPPLPVPRLDHEVRHIIDVFEKQRKLESGRLQSCALTTVSEDKISPSTPCLTVGSIYRKLYHRFLARRILKRTQTIHNRRTFITLYENEIFEENNANGEWISESCLEKTQRNLEALGIKISHTLKKWNDNQHRYGCFQPSLLRWTWRVAENGNDEEHPNENHAIRSASVSNTMSSIALRPLQPLPAKTFDWADETISAIERGELPDFSSQHNTAKPKSANTVLASENVGSMEETKMTIQREPDWKNKKSWRAKDEPARATVLAPSTQAADYSAECSQSISHEVVNEVMSIARTDSRSESVVSDDDSFCTASEGTTPLSAPSPGTSQLDLVEQENSHSVRSDENFGERVRRALPESSNPNADFEDHIRKQLVRSLKSTENLNVDVQSQPIQASIVDEKYYNTSRDGDFMKWLETKLAQPQTATESAGDDGNIKPKADKAPSCKSSGRNVNNI